MEDSFSVPTSDGLTLAAHLSYSHPQPLLLCVYLHGLNFSSHCFLPLLHCLQQQAELPLCFARFDLRGHGASTRAPATAALPLPPLDLSCQRLLLDAEAVLAAVVQRHPALGRLPPVLLGHSLGGALAAKHAAQLEAAAGAGRGGGCSGRPKPRFVDFLWTGHRAPSACAGLGTPD